LDGRIEVQPPALVKQADGSRGQRHRDGADAEPRERRRRHPLFDIGPAEGLGPGDPTVLRHGDREARQVLVDHQRAGQTPGFLDGARVARGWRGGRG
jgi:hypothetical protein